MLVTQTSRLQIIATLALLLTHRAVKNTPERPESAESITEGKRL